MHTRHKEEKYKQHAVALAECITARTGWKVLFNQVPKQWSKSSLYNQLIPNSDASVNVYDMIPRLGAFEVSFVFHNSPFLKEQILDANKADNPFNVKIYSKFATGMWPNYSNIGEICHQMDTILKGPFLTDNHLSLFLTGMETTEMPETTDSHVKKQWDLHRAKIDDIQRKIADGLITNPWSGVHTLYLNMTVYDKQQPKKQAPKKEAPKKEEPKQQYEQPA